jgi:hypothetical protein
MSKLHSYAGAMLFWKRYKCASMDFGSPRGHANLGTIMPIWVVKRYKCASMNFWSGDLFFPLSLTLPLPRKHIYRGSYPGNIYIEDQNLEKVQMCLNGILGQVTQFATQALS